MSTPTVLRVQPVYEKTNGQKRTLAKTDGHNHRKDGDLKHVDPSRTHLNRTLLGTNDIVADVQNITNQYARSSKKGPICGELILTANADFFEKLSEAEKVKWAKDSLAWAIAEFDGKGQGRVANCTWHRDEKAEHLHIVVVPVASTVTGNQHRQNTITAINYSAVLGKPPGGEKNIPPAERRWGLKQTNYANFMAEMGHDLIRGVRNRKLKNKTPTEWQIELNARFVNLIEQIESMPDRGKIEFSKQEIVQFIMAQIDSKTHDLTSDQKALSNQVQSLQQALTDSAQLLGCPTPSYLPQYCQDFINSWRKNHGQPGKRDIVEYFQDAAKNGAANRQLEKQQAVIKQPRSVKGQRKSPEERREARATRKLLSDVPNISSITINLRGYHHESRIINELQRTNNQQHQYVGENT